MARDKGNPATIFDAIVARLISQIEGTNAASCFWSIDPNSLPSSSPGDLVYVVAPLSGDFDEGMMIGGGLEQLTANGGFVVRIYSPLQVDQANQDSKLLTSLSGGLLATATKVIAALANWSPVDSSDNEQTRDPIFPAGFSFGRPGGKKRRSLGWIEVSFRLTFDWDVSAQAVAP